MGFVLPSFETEVCRARRRESLSEEIGAVRLPVRVLRRRGIWTGDLGDVRTGAAAYHCSARGILLYEDTPGSIRGLGGYRSLSWASPCKRETHAVGQ